MTNINTNTGIRFGYIGAQDLDPDLVHELMYSVGTDLSYQEAVNEICAGHERMADAIEERCEADLEDEGHSMEDPGYEGLLEDRVESAYDRLGFYGREDYVDTRTEREAEYLSIDEPIIEGTYQGVSYQTSWLGGALNFWIFESPVVNRFDLCSPCVPGAGNLHCPNPDGHEAYDVPAEWRVGV